MTTKPFKVMCVCVGTKYGQEYVERLYNGLIRNTTVPIDFDVIKQSEYPGWWSKMDLFPAKERTIYLDLDVIIVGNVDFLFEYQGPFCLMRNLGGWYNSSVMSIAEGWGKELKRNFVQTAGLMMTKYYGDQEYIEAHVPSVHFWPDEKVVSYKHHECEKLGLPKDARIVVCHGQPKPADLLSTPWVAENWNDNL